MFARRTIRSSIVAGCLGAFIALPARAVTIEWMPVGDPGNVGQTINYFMQGEMTFGAVASAFEIMKYEMTNTQYVDYLNVVDPTGINPYSVYNPSMGSDARGGITNTGTVNGSRYAVKASMGDKPVNYVNWFDAARVANWLHNGATGTSSTETGAYTLVGGQTSGIAPAKNANARYYLPTESQWHKAAYYKGGGTNAGYWDYPTQVSGTDPTAVTAGPGGLGSAGSSGNFANFDYAADWNTQNGNVTSVGTNGGPSAYGLYDMGGNVWEWNDLDGTAGSPRGLRGGGWDTGPFDLSSSARNAYDPADEYSVIGIRLAAVPEPSTWVMGVGGLAGAAWGAWRRRTRT